LTRRRIACSLAVALVAACPSPRQGEPLPESFALVGVNIVDVETGQVHPNRTVLIVGRRISSIEPGETAQLHPSTRLVDAGGKYLVPGLWDSHVHLTPFGEAVLPLFVAYGVTAVRDAGSTDVIFRWRTEIAAGERLGPRIWTAGRMLTQTRAADPGPEWEQIASPEAARDAVARRQNDGADFLKIQDSFMEGALWSATADEAAARRLPLIGHTPVDLPLATAIRLGLRSIEHTLGLPLALTTSEQRLRTRVMGVKSESGRWSALYAADVEALHTISSSRLTSLAKFMRDRGVALSPNLTDSRAMATAGSGRWKDDPRLAMVRPAVRELWRGTAAATTPADRRNLALLYQQIPPIVLALHRGVVTILAGTEARAVYDFQ
jgi:imidazolonepropionase-like amidohydrolase